jgi:predicted nucleotidyltransferase
MRLTTQDVIKVIKDNEIEIRKFGVKEIYLFGSVVRGEAKDNSDVDFLIVFEPTYPASFFTLYDLEQFLTEKLSTKVDLGTKLHPMLKDQIMREALRVA